MASIDLFASCANLAELWWTRRGVLPAAALAQHRLDALVRHARAKSALYRELYRGVPDGDVALRDLPPVTKQRLMSHFDDWVTDPQVRLRDVAAFLGDRVKVGDRFLGRYHAWKSSGTTGEPAIFLQDAQAMAAYDALVAIQLQNARWNRDTIARALSQRGRAALAVATGDHFASICSWERMRRAMPGIEARGFSVLDPTPKLVARLNAWRPAFLAAYASVLALLAGEQEAGRLAIQPALLWSGGEHLGSGAARSIERIFGCPVMNEYGASECLSIAYGCAQGWLHVNSEWVVVEPVDRQGRPVAPGELSHTALLTNLANWVQPIIRYDLGDRIVAHPGPCRCGNASPAIRVEGRAGEVLALRSRRGAVVKLPPLAVATVVEASVGTRRFQVAQTAPDRLALRIGGRRGKALEKARAQATAALAAYLQEHALPNVRLVRDDAPPQRDATSGKMREVIVQTGGV